eukprot:CAMPEP_0201283630 /NCGR_PEP_ID=MMETSP1317-20130820/31794_1 /ASSEMBLY_ACC=CAM_ASM_000770 /TAXON_ID=187299 /ORGANISM="Undescribed Undescribed, Strain Undescribed" /LENGTH=60 /DNA_ID=CAMNT_0047600555 /DNA_START=416 /DNA_END=598 /DNA_ORIENTATION=+
MYQMAPPHVKDIMDTTKQIQKDLLGKNEVLVRVYVLDCFNLMSMDSEGNSDPYLRLSLGK